MIYHRIYQVGGHRFALYIPKEIMSEKELMAYSPFKTSYTNDNNLLFSLTLQTEADLVSISGAKTAELEDENGRMTLYKLPDGEMAMILFTTSGDECCRMSISKDFRQAQAWIGGDARARRYALDTSLMLLYSFASSSQETLLIHASAVEYDSSGYLFLGKSGTGKSTHSRLWIENIKGAELLNDDNPIVRIIDGAVYVYGSPWSGKTQCYLNKRVRVGGIVRLQQASYNHISKLTGIKAYAAILTSCSCMKWDHLMAEDVHNTISKVIAATPVYSLQCLPDKEAAEICWKEVKEVISER